MEQLLLDGQVPLKGESLLSLRKMSLQQLLQMVKPTMTVAFSSVGTPTTIHEVCRDLAKQHYPVVIVGGFPHGHFSKTTSEVADRVVSIYDKPLDAWVVASRIVYEYELASGK
jgi:rRNA small subunit pseudouridine methyltransferase Nep1